ncbi:DUF418 domain-containing protein [Arcicella aquatica]|uniref:DUF418 domain-containing protein n=1 Tax=Arcicella aquatica TaxID=217141 RepID=A0ABU5QTG9_9BACT|nr:DUF418 domain-containing protein [Arcicella aquatica]MEA5260019.1 DUF418 domain-containing protein [Arcicella aquatica]
MKKRILLVDALRGFALLGIILAHIGGWFIAGSMPSEVWQKYQTDTASTIVNYIDAIFISGKFYTFFSFFFGVSFALQLLQRKEDDQRFLPRFMWRLIILFIIGFIHHIHWRGDILGIYAFLGFFMILFRNASEKVLLVAILFFTLNVPSFVREVIAYNQPPEKPKSEKEQKAEQTKSEKETAQSYYTLKKGTYAEVIVQNFKDFAFKARFQWESGRIFVTFGFFLLGLWVGKRKIFEHLSDRQRLIKKIMWWSIGVNVFIIAFFLTIDIAQLWDKMPKWFGMIGNFLFSLHSLLMTIFYIAGLSLWFSKNYMEKVMLNFAAIGKMALTNYLLQSAIGILLFYGIGFGLAGEISPAWCYVIGIVIFSLQIVFSKWWLSKFKYGPMEWLWRSATYLRWQV